MTGDTRGGDGLGNGSRTGGGGAATQAEVLIPGEHDLEGLLEWPEGDEVLGGVVVAHPHPLYGGTMRQPVVHHVARACRRKGLATLRFNFRGVGASAGSYTGLEEFHDVRAAAAFLRAQLPTGLPVSLAGYSFGSWMTALAAIDGEPAAALALVAFPVEWDEFSPVFFERLGEFAGPVIAVCGEFDTISPPADAEAFLRSVGLDPELVVVAGVDHFFMGAGEQVAEPAADFLLRASVERTR
ncbi:MAG: alpha/beta hydrolase [Thermoleophilia bacterium]